MSSLKVTAQLSNKDMMTAVMESLSETTKSHGIYRQERREGTFVNLGSVSPCISMHSNELIPTRCSNYRFIACRLNTAQYVSGILLPIIRSLSTAAAASGLP